MNSFFWNIPAMKPPPGLTSNFVDPPSKDRVLILLNSIFFSFMVLFVILRIATRILITHEKIWWDDYACILSAFGILAHTALVLRGIHVGVYGRHLWDIRALSMTHSIIIQLSILDVVYTVTIWTIKISILLLFWRFFNLVSKACRWAIVLGIGACTILTIPFLGIAVYRAVNCSSVKAIGVTMCKSNNVSITQTVSGALAIATDFYILSIPIFMLRKLHVDKKKKIAMFAPFLAGFIACSMSIVRLSFIDAAFYSPDVMWKAADNSQFTTVEMNLAIICSCMLFVPAVLKKFKAHGVVVYGRMASKTPKQSLPELPSSNKSSEKRENATGSHHINKWENTCADMHMV